ncbi:hypothetical protein NVIE_2544 [Nitrososphaera viennensis EN76]|uniref:Uncharacterized protein n=1 Tax=Nitrososphaera viennensis EN76 TaxID=926571 RepID=A0A060HJM4_9ARCH|nr:hypothetical protein NVIE_2544 [Nitrososphaera viennensis EN76]
MFYSYDIHIQCKLHNFVSYIFYKK